MLFGIENSLKARKGQFAALVDPAIITARAASEAALRRKVDADPQLREQYGPAWDNVRAALDRFRGMRDRYVFTEGGQGFRSRLFGFAKTLVRHAAEAKKPDEARLREYTDENFRGQRQTLTSRAPHLSGARKAHADVLADQAARGAGSRRSLRAQGAGQQGAGAPRGRARRRHQARRRGAAPQPHRRRRSRHRRDATIR